MPASGNRPPRYLPERPFPPYAYVPGCGPHPRRRPGIHVATTAGSARTPLEPRAWRDCADYLFGIDLFNFGYYWEAHEAWEELWRPAAAGSPTKQTLRGLIRLAAAGVKAREANARGCARHARQAAVLLRAVRDELGAARHLGLDLDRLADAAERLAVQPRAADVRDARPRPVLGLRLRPGTAAAANRPARPA